MSHRVSPWILAFKAQREIACFIEGVPSCWDNCKLSPTFILTLHTHTAHAKHCVDQKLKHNLHLHILIQAYKLQHCGAHLCLQDPILEWIWDRYAIDSMKWWLISGIGIGKYSKFDRWYWHAIKFYVQTFVWSAPLLHDFPSIRTAWIEFGVQILYHLT